MPIPDYTKYVKKYSVYEVINTYFLCHFVDLNEGMDIDQKHFLKIQSFWNDFKTKFTLILDSVQEKKIHYLFNLDCLIAFFISIS